MNAFVDYQPSDFLCPEKALSKLGLSGAALGRGDVGLASLAALCGKLFSAPLPFADNAQFFGAQLPDGFFAHLRSPYRNAAGRGCNLLDAFRSCMGELAEIIAIQSNLSATPDRLAPPMAEMRRPERDWFADILGVPASQVPDLEKVNATLMGKTESLELPAEAAFVLPEARRLGERAPSNDGAGSGVTLDDALCAGHLEVIERDAAALWWYGGSAARAVSNSELRDLGVYDFAAEIGRRPERKWWILEIKNTFGLPVCCALSCNQAGEDVVAGFAAKTSLTDAAKASLLEMSQMELASLISNARSEMVPFAQLSKMDRQWVQQKRAISVLKTPAILGNCIEDRFSDDLLNVDAASLAALLKQSGFRALYLDMSLPDQEMATVKVIIPGLQPMTSTTITDRLKQQCETNDRVIFDIPHLM